MLPNLDLSRLDQPQLEPNRKAFNHTQSTSQGVFIVMTVFSGCVPRGRLGKKGIRGRMLINTRTKHNLV